MTPARHHTMPGRRPTGVYTHRTGTDFGLKLKSCDFNGVRPGTVRYLKSSSTFENLLTHRPMPIWAPNDARPGTGRCFMSRTATGEERCLFAKVHITST